MKLDFEEANKNYEMRARERVMCDIKHYVEAKAEAELTLKAVEMVARDPDQDSEALQYEVDRAEKDCVWYSRKLVIAKAKLELLPEEDFEPDLSH